MTTETEWGILGEEIDTEMGIEYLETQDKLKNEILANNRKARETAKIPYAERLVGNLK